MWNVKSCTIAQQPIHWAAVRAFQRSKLGQGPLPHADPSVIKLKSFDSPSVKQETSRVCKAQCSLRPAAQGLLALWSGLWRLNHINGRKHSIGSSWHHAHSCARWTMELPQHCKSVCVCVCICLFVSVRPGGKSVSARRKLKAHGSERACHLSMEAVTSTQTWN